MNWKKDWKLLKSSYNKSVFFFDRYLFENKLNKNKKMKNIVRLTESDLTRLVKRVINEAVIASLEKRDLTNNANSSGQFQIDASGTMKLTFKNGVTKQLTPEDLQV